jgi:predicted nuclease of restriction endonuclease-like (RecB) superfamily
VKEIEPLQTDDMLQYIRNLIDETRSSIATAVNAGLTLLYWRIGKRINDELLLGERAEYGKSIVVTVSRQLTADYGQSFTEKNLRRMVQFSQIYPDERIVVSLIRQLSWTHFIALLPLKDPLQRDFYSEMCRIERWNVRTLRTKIDSMLFERTVLSRKPEDLIRQELTELRDDDQMTPELVFRDPYVLDFLNLADTYSEHDLESAILRELERFLLELGSGFTFVARQKRMIIDGEDHYLDLLFFHRRLRRLVAIELKLAKFKAADKGQMELYLRWLERNEIAPGEETPLGLILCAEGARETVELLRLDDAGIHMAEYLTELPTKGMLAEKLHTTIAHARLQLENRAE